MLRQGCAVNRATGGPVGDRRLRKSGWLDYSAVAGTKVVPAARSAAFPVKALFL
jgi:hypothetical protein